MDSGWLLADGEAVASAQQVRTLRERRRATRSARRGEVAVVLRAPAVVLGPLDVICVRDGTAVASAARVAGRSASSAPAPSWSSGSGTAERHGVRRGTAVELRWTT